MWMDTTIITAFVKNSSKNSSNDTDTTTPSNISSADSQTWEFWIGLTLAVSAGGFNGGCFIFQKLGLLRVKEKHQGASTADGGCRYVYEWKWWIGMLLMALGEICNFGAFILAPATLVTPLGALSVIFSAILASYFLKERLNLICKVGCVLCVIGSTVVVIHSPRNSDIHNMNELLQRIKMPGILSLVGIIIVAAILTIVFLAPRFGQSNVVVYIFVCSTLGSLTVMGVKGLGVALKQTFAGDQQFTNWLTYVMTAVAAVDIFFQIKFLNKALDTFNTAVVTPTYYVMFTSFVTLTSLVLYNEFSKMKVVDMIGDLCGFLTIVCGIFMLNVFKDMKVSLENLPMAKNITANKSYDECIKIVQVERDCALVLNKCENESEDEMPLMCSKTRIINYQTCSNLSFEEDIEIKGGTVTKTGHASISETVM